MNTPNTDLKNKLSNLRHLSMEGCMLVRWGLDIKDGQYEVIAYCPGTNRRFGTFTFPSAFEAERAVAFALGAPRSDTQSDLP